MLIFIHIMIVLGLVWYFLTRKETGNFPSGGVDENRTYHVPHNEYIILEVKKYYLVEQPDDFHRGDRLRYVGTEYEAWKNDSVTYYSTSTEFNFPLYTSEKYAETYKLHIQRCICPVIAENEQGITVNYKGSVLYLQRDT